MKKIIIFSLFIFTVLFGGVRGVLAIGQVTKPIVIKDMLRGQEAIETLSLFNSNDSDITYGLMAEGDIADWTSFYKIGDKKTENKINEIVVPPNAYYNLIVKFTVPDDMPNGEYIGKVYIFTKNNENNKEGESDVSLKVGQRIGRKVTISVTDKEVFKFNTTIVPMKYNINSGEPFIVKCIYENEGNVSVKPTIHFRVTRKGKAVFNAFFPFPEDESPIRAFERRSFPELIKWQTAGQEDGYYQAEIEVMINDKVFQQKKFKFSIGNAKAADGSVLGDTDKRNFGYYIFWPLAGVALLILIVATVVFFRKSAKPNKAENHSN